MEFDDTRPRRARSSSVPTFDLTAWAAAIKSSLLVANERSPPGFKDASWTGAVASGVSPGFSDAGFDAASWRSSS